MTHRGREQTVLRCVRSQMVRSHHRYHISVISDTTTQSIEMVPSIPTTVPDSVDTHILMNIYLVIIYNTGI